VRDPGWSGLVDRITHQCWKYTSRYGIIKSRTQTPLSTLQRVWERD